MDTNKKEGEDFLKERERLYCSKIILKQKMTHNVKLNTPKIQPRHGGYQFGHHLHELDRLRVYLVNHYPTSMLSTLS